MLSKYKAEAPGDFLQLKSTVAVVWLHNINEVGKKSNKQPVTAAGLFSPEASLSACSDGVMSATTFIAALCPLAEQIQLYNSSG